MKFRNGIGWRAWGVGILAAGSTLWSQTPLPPSSAAPPPDLKTPSQPTGPAAAAPSSDASPKSKLSPLANTPPWKNLEQCSEILTKEEFDEALRSVYLDGSKFPVPWHEDAGGVTVETSPDHPPLRIKFRQRSGSPAVEAYRFWRRADELPALKAGEGVLTGLQIALDPGHIGGSYAQMEGRWLQMNGMSPIMEGHMTLQVAEYLKPRLEALGARVSMVRQQEAPITTAKPDDFRVLARNILAEKGIAQAKEDYAGLSGIAKIITVQYQAEKLFYLVSEIRARAKRVNEELKPDLVICMHFNAEDWGDPATPAFVPHNHFHLLVNGCYMPDELQLEDIRYDMFERVFHRIDAEEIRVGDAVASAMAQSTGLPPFVYPEPKDFEPSSARRVDANPYVWARNLLANRIYQCPVIYLEPYVMNHEETYKRLMLGHWIGRTLVDGKLVTSPEEDYVRGIVNGLSEYYGRARSKG